MFTPAANLLHGAESGLHELNEVQGYTSLGIASQGTPHADVLEIQAQQDEGTNEFDSSSPAAVGQAQAANPSALDPRRPDDDHPARSVTAQLLLNDYLRDAAAGLRLLAEHSRRPRGSPQPAGRRHVPAGSRSTTRLLGPRPGSRPTKSVPGSRFRDLHLTQRRAGDGAE